MSDLIRRLRKRAPYWNVIDAQNMLDAADRIEADEALLRQALEAFDSMYGRKPERVEKVVAALRARLDNKLKEPK